MYKHFQKVLNMQNFILVLGVQNKDCFDFPKVFTNKFWKIQSRNFSRNRNFRVGGIGPKGLLNNRIRVTWLRQVNLSYATLT